MSKTDGKITNLNNTKFIYLTSQNRSSGSINSFSINLPLDFFESQKNQIVKISLHNLVLTKSWYETRTGVSADFLLNSVPQSFTQGSYTIDTLLIELGNKFAGIYNIVYDYPTNKFTFSAISGATTFTPINCGYLLGITNNQTYTGTFVSENPVNMTYEKTLYVNTDVSSTHSSLDNIFNNRATYSTILAEVPITNAPFDVITFHSGLQPNSGIVLASKSIDTLRVYISTDKGNVPTFYEDFTISFRIEFFEEEAL